MTVLDLHSNSVLKELYCNDTPLFSLDLSGNPLLELLHCYNTQIIEPDVSMCDHLKEFLNTDPASKSDDDSAVLLIQSILTGPVEGDSMIVDGKIVPRESK